MKTDVAVETHSWWVDMSVAVLKTGVAVSKTGARGYNRSGDVAMVATSPVSVRGQVGK